jgi:hypothetical protein
MSLYQTGPSVASLQLGNAYAPIQTVSLGSPQISAAPVQEPAMALMLALGLVAVRVSRRR